MAQPQVPSTLPTPLPRLLDTPCPDEHAPPAAAAAAGPTTTLGQAGAAHFVACASRTWVAHTLPSLTGRPARAAPHAHAVWAFATAAAAEMVGAADPLAVLTRLVAAGGLSSWPDAVVDLVYEVVAAAVVVGCSAKDEGEDEGEDDDATALGFVCLAASLDALPPALARYYVRAAAGCAEVVPGARAIIAALASPSLSKLAPLFPATADGSTDALAAALASPTGDGCLVLDFSTPGSPHVADPELAMAEAGAVLGLGKYMEVRCIYEADAYAPAPAVRPPTLPCTSPDPDPVLPRRDMHLGIDLFAPAGTPVAAVLDGRVHSFANNKAAQDYGPTIVLAHRTADVLGFCPAGAPHEFYTLYGHLSMSSLAGLVRGMRFAAGAVVGTLGARDVNGGWAPHLHFQLVMDMCGKDGDFEGVAVAGAAPVYAQLTPNPNVLLRIPRLGPHISLGVASAASDDAELAARRAAVLSANLSLSFAQPLHIVRGAGQYLYASDGTRFLDCVNNVAHVGHCHPRVVSAAAAQMAVLNTNTRYLHTGIVDYADALLATFPEPLNVVFFVNSGSEANDLALRLAATATGGDATLVLDAAYHGNVSSMIARSPYKFNAAGGAGCGENVHILPSPDPYRSPETCDGATAAAAAVAAAEGRGQTVGAFFAESVLGCGGQIVLPDGYLAGAYDVVRAAGGVCIADEVQVGFGRVGSAFWGFETQGVVPDIVTMGKPMGNGHPLAGVVTTRAIADAFANGMEYFNTFGGNPVSMAVGAAVLDVIHQEQLVANAADRGRELLDGFRALMDKHELIGDVRGVGLFVGVELVRDRATKVPAVPEIDAVVEHMRSAHNIFVSTDGPLHNVLKLKPPMVLTAADTCAVIAALDDALCHVAAQQSGPGSE